MPGKLIVWDETEPAFARIRHSSTGPLNKNPTDAAELHCGQRMRDGSVKDPCYAVTTTQDSGVAVRRLGDQPSYWKLIRVAKGLGWEARATVFHPRQRRYQ